MKVVIVEDEVLATQRLARFLKEIIGENLRMKMYRTLDEADDYLAGHETDLLLLDLNLNGRDGFELLKSSVSSSFHTIIVSANADRAIEAFEYGVIDFVAKPYSKQRIEKALDRLNHDQRQSGTRYLTVRKFGRLELVDVSGIAFIRAAGAYSELVMQDLQEHLHDKSLNTMLGILPPDFQQVHKSYIVPLQQVKALLRHQGSRYELELHNGHKVPLGRTRYPKIKKMLSS
jgi:two-component system response regulator LytT